MSKAIPAYVFGAKEEATKEKVIFRREYDPYMKTWGYLAGFPNDEANKGRIAVFDFKIFENGTVQGGCHDEADKNYFTKLKLVHKGTDEADMCLNALKKLHSDEDFYVAEKITRKDRCY